MKKIYFLCTSIVFALLITSSSASADLTKSKIKSEFKYTWHKVHGENGWKLIDLQVMDIINQGSDKYGTVVATTNISYKYKKNGKIITKTSCSFQFWKSKDTNHIWEMFDREDPKVGSLTWRNMTGQCLNISK